MMTNLNTDKEGLKKKLKEIEIEDPLESKILNEVYLMLSLKCNLRCKVCAWWGIKGPCRNKDFLDKYSPSLSLKELKSFADDVIPFRPKIITFSGGEPLLYNKWYILAKYFKERGIKVSLTTNGVYLRENFPKVTEVVDEISVSLGGPPSILHLIRENPPLHFKRILRGLKMLANFRKRNKNRPALKILYTISELSCGHMEELIKFMQEEGIEIDRYQFQHLMLINQDTLELQKKVLAKEFGIRNAEIWKGYTYFPSKMNFSKLRKEMEKVRKYKNTSFSPDLYPEELRSYYRHNRGAAHYLKYCTAPWHQIDMMPNGDIYTCHDYFIGNIKESSFNDIWNGQKAGRLRSYLMKRLFPGCKGCFYHYCERKK